jgi:hypothetical protein
MRTDVRTSARRASGPVHYSALTVGWLKRSCPLSL